MSKPKWIAFDVDDSKFVKPKAANSTKSSKKQSVKNNEQSTPKPRNNCHVERDFHKLMQPADVTDLAVHPKKVTDVENWLKKSVIDRCEQNSQILLIIGPSGSGKSITLRILCKLLRIELREWINPVDLDLENYRRQGDQFYEFLVESKYKSLFDRNVHKVVVVKDIPNFFLKNEAEFESVIERYCGSNNGSAIFICSESASSEANFYNKLFSDGLKSRYNIQSISFNATSATLLKCAIKRAQALTNSHPDFKTLAPEYIESIIASSSGDLRCALNQFYFASLKCAQPLEITASDGIAKSKRKRMVIAGQLKQMTRDETLGLFHSVGRVLNPKFRENGSGRLACDVQLLINEFETYPGTALGFIHENYPPHFGRITDVFDAASALSDAEIVVNRCWQHSYGSELATNGLWVGIVGVMLSNRHRLSVWHPIRAPKKIPRRTRMSDATSHIAATDLSFYKLLSKLNTHK